MFQIRKAEKKDCELINQLAAQVWEPTYGKLLSKDQLDYMFQWMYAVSSIEEQMNQGHTYYIAYDKENPVGYLSIEKESETIFHLQKIYILPTAQRRGVGEFLIKKAEEHACLYKTAPICYIELNVNRNNPAVDFYQKMGFVIDREVNNDIGNGFYMNDYIMKKEITCK